METWTRNEKGTWKRWNHPGLALDAMTNSSMRVRMLLVIGSERADDEQLFATIRLARRLVGGSVKVIAGNVHPSAGWLASVHQAGVDQALLVPKPQKWRWPGGPLLDNAVELDSSLCPELHVRDEQKVTASVCGRYLDRMVLTRRHFDRWCLAKKEDCPHWQGGPRG